MDKKGEIFPTIFATAMIVLTISAAVLTINKGDKIYVGNKEQMNFIEYAKCPARINDIQENNRIIFESIPQAQDNGFTPVEGYI